MKDYEITLENCSVEYKHPDGTLTLFGYAGQPHDATRQLMERYLLPPKHLIQYLFQPSIPDWPTLSIPHSS
jgi:hypothetical protein